jgi:hypothetical protein
LRLRPDHHGLSAVAATQRAVTNDAPLQVAEERLCVVAPGSTAASTPWGSAVHRSLGDMEVLVQGQILDDKLMAAAAKNGKEA